MNETIMVIDDEVATTSFIKKGLTNIGYKVRVVLDATEAIAQIYKYKPDLIVLDYHLGGISGLAVRSALLSSDATKHIPVIIVTGYADDNIADKIDKNIIKDYIIKPFDINDLIKKIETVLSRKDPGDINVN